MKILAIIVEYNPMHNGHIYQIKKAKELVQPDYTIVIMSGNFTEQGNLSVINKFKKAELAIENGIDLVLELPSIYAISSAEYFSKGAVNILNSLNCVTHLAFGAECSSIYTLQNIANIINKYYDEITSNVKEYADKSNTSIKTRNIFLEKYLTYNELQQLSKPNNLLAIEYLRNLQLLNSNIEPVLIERMATTHNSMEITNNFASSTNIRKLIENDMKSDIVNLVPQNVFHNLPNTKYIDKMWYILKYEITKLGKTGILNIHEVCEGLNNRIYDSAIISNSYTEFLNNVNTKRYTLGRIKRICIYILLGITEDNFKMLNNKYYARVLKISDNKKELLSITSQNANIPVITKVLQNNVNDNLTLDILATKIHNVIFEENTNDYTNNIIYKNS